MEEIEVKILDIDKKEIIKKIESWGAKKTFEGDMHVSFYDFPDKRLSKKKSMLRLRTKGPISELTLKSNTRKDVAKIATEENIDVSNHRTTERILECLGMAIIKKIAKNRISYTLGKIHFEIDTFSGYPSFLEVEAPTLLEIEATVARLGYMMKDTKPWTGKDVINYYKQKKARNQLLGFSRK